ncbi:TetR/AcrR family transcriptional regulator [Uruburuella testudinis]|uniref:TetR/AcrR family transcriptional regulator n=1 Tax=Uruburuella testudinis TaxID=1282863 RepID=A0ABY4DVF1_9NEIS|nr:TetR/AcrR family transcriptional regulator [Uruburuella testudinis]UOO83014.1 TetR/AcrR family transcriptional regulator [Uruburuella testudinis]
MSDSARAQLIAAGLKLYPQYGYAKLSVRLLAAEAGVSPGMFHHVFASKDAFVAEVLVHQYQRTFGRLTLSGADTEDAFLHLREILRQQVRCLRDNLDWVQRAFADSGEGVAVVRDFWHRHFQERHEQLMALLNRCRALPVSEQVHRLAYLLGAVGAPMVIGTRMREMDVLPADLGAYMSEIIEDAAIDRRIDWALSALFPEAKIPS